MTTMSITTVDAKEEFSELINRVAHNKERIILTRRGKEIVAVIPIEDFYAWQASEDKSDLFDATEALKEARLHGAITLTQFKSMIGS